MVRFGCVEKIGGGQLGLGHESTHWDYYESFHSPDIGDVETIWANANGCYALKKGR